MQILTLKPPKLLQTVACPRQTLEDADCQSQEKRDTDSVYQDTIQRYPGKLAHGRSLLDIQSQLRLMETLCSLRAYWKLEGEVRGEIRTLTLKPPFRNLMTRLLSELITNLRFGIVL